jgi:hypothetical protein
MRFAFSAPLALALAMLCPVEGAAQESKSEALAKQLAAALDAAKLDSIAAADPTTPGSYVGALYIAGGQLMTVAVKYPAPGALDQKLASKAYRDVYLDLSAIRSTGAKLMIEDMGANGLNQKPRDNDPIDTIELDGKRVALDNEPRRQKITSEEYQKTFEAADARYSQMLSALLAQLKKGS